MSKKIVAITQIHHGMADGETYIVQAGEEVNPGKFTKEQLEALYDAGAVSVDEGAEEAPAPKEVKAEPKKASGGQSNAK